MLPCLDLRLGRNAGELSPKNPLSTLGGGDRGLTYAVSPGSTTRRPYLGMGCGLQNYAPCDGSRSPHVRWPKLRWHCAKKAPPKRGLKCVMQKRELSISRQASY